MNDKLAKELVPVEVNPDGLDIPAFLRRNLSAEHKDGAVDSDSDVPFDGTENESEKEEA